MSLALEQTLFPLFLKFQGIEAKIIVIEAILDANAKATRAFEE